MSEYFRFLEDLYRNTITELSDKYGEKDLMVVNSTQGSFAYVPFPEYSLWIIRMDGGPWRPGSKEYLRYFINGKIHKTSREIL